jgi:hypothetical protein
MGVALGWLCTPKYMPSICLVYGFVVALGGFARAWTSPKGRQGLSAAKLLPNCAKRREGPPSADLIRRAGWRCRKGRGWFESGSKLHALQTLRAAAHLQEPSQLENNLDHRQRGQAPFLLCVLGALRVSLPAQATGGAAPIPDPPSLLAICLKICLASARQESKTIHMGKEPVRLSPRNHNML